MAEITGFFTLRDTEEDTGLARFTGTDIVRFLGDSIVSASSGRCYVSGSIINTSPIPCRLRILSGNLVIANGFLPGYGILKMTRLPFTDIKIAINGTVALRSVGFVTDAKTPEEEAAFLTQSSIEFIDRNYRNVNHVFDQGFNVDDLGDATHPIIASITDDRNLIIGKLIFSCDAACDAQIQYERNGETQLIGNINFGASGFIIIDNVPPCTLGSQTSAIDVVLEVIITNGAATNINTSGHFAEE